MRTQRRRISCLLALCSLAFGSSQIAAPAAPPKPNIVYILADDLGYGDVSSLNPQGRIRTPNMDRLAREGMTFTDAHSGSAVCSPTRYGLLTGRYAWRSKLKKGVLGGLSPRLIEQGRTTVASFLKQHGYQTGCVGKWHLGMDWHIVPGKEVSPLSIETREQVRNVDYAKPISNGPNSVGFDYYFGISASLDMVPYAYIENDRVTKLPTEDRNFEMFLGRTGRTREGPAAPDFDAANVLPDLTGAAVKYIGQRAADAKGGKPFFLYLPFASPHTPIAPTAQWQGKSGLNAYADFVMQTDAAVGEILQALEKHNLAANTLIILTSDNGCSPQADFAELKEKGHNPSHVFRGTKADIFEGGHRVPFLARWPNRIKAGSAYNHPVCHTDLLATCADLVKVKLPPDAAEDSVSILPALLGKTSKARREATVHHSANGTFAIRQDQWKLIFSPDSGGWSSPRPSEKTNSLPAVQLYDLNADIAEQHNLQDKHPRVVRRLTRLLEQYAADGRSTPGPRQENDGEVDLWRKTKAPSKNAKKK